MPITSTTKLIITSLTTVGVGGAIGGGHYLLKPDSTKSTEQTIENKDETKTLPNQVAEPQKKGPDAGPKTTEAPSNPPKVQNPAPEGGNRIVTFSDSETGRAET